MKHLKKLLTILMMTALVFTATVPYMTESASAAVNSSTIKGVENTTIKAKTALTEDGKIKVTWTKSKGYKVDCYQVYRATSKNGTYKRVYTTKSGSKTSYTNTSVKEGKRYYYKVRGVRKINGKNYYTQWSNKANRTAKLPEPVITYNGEKLSFASGAKPYRNTYGDIMVPLEAVAEYFGFEVSDFMTSSKQITKTWTKETAPYVLDLNGDGKAESYPCERTCVFFEGDGDVYIGKDAYMWYNETTGRVEKTDRASSSYLYGYTFAVVKDDVFYVPMKLLAEAMLLDVSYNTGKTECRLMPYLPYKLTGVITYYEKDEPRLWLADVYENAEIEFSDVFIIYNEGTDFKDLNFEPMGKGEIRNIAAEAGLDPERVNGIILPGADAVFRECGQCNVVMDIKLLKDNGAEAEDLPEFYIK